MGLISSIGRPTSVDCTLSTPRARRREALDPPLGVEHDDRDVDGVEQVHQIGVALAHFLIAAVQLVVDGGQLLVGRLQLLLRRLELLVHALQLFVARDELFVGRGQIVVGARVLFDERLEILLRRRPARARARRRRARRAACLCARPFGWRSGLRGDALLEQHEEERLLDVGDAGERRDGDVALLACRRCRRRRTPFRRTTVFVFFACANAIRNGDSNPSRAILNRLCCGVPAAGSR